MDPSHFPPNSAASSAGNEREVQPIEGVNARRKRRSLRRQFTETFVAGDLRSSLRYVLLDIWLPDIQTMLLEGGYGLLEKLIRGESRRSGSGSTVPSHGAAGYQNYGRFSMGSALLPSAQRAMSRAARAGHNFDEIVLSTRGEAEQVIFRLEEELRGYGSVTVANLYELVDLAPAYTDTRWGWTSLQGAGVTRRRDGWVLDLPPAIPVPG